MKKKAYFLITYFFVLLLLTNSFSILSAQNDISVTNEGDINTPFQEYSPAFYKNGLVFIGSNPAVAEDKKTDDATGKKATSFFLAMRAENGSLKKVVPFAEELTTKFYDGPLSFNADGSIIYFTRSNLRRGKAIKAKDGLVKLKIYAAEKNESGWANITDLSLNLPEYDCTHPSVSPDGKRLYFASNRPDGFGGMDLYACTFINGKWSIPVNCGPKVNTAKNEIFPFIHADGTLYFTTNGREGLGNLDIFYTMKTDTGWLSPKALPEPINSASDDFGLIVSADKQSGYFSSNRASGKGDDDIYSFIAPNNINEAVLAVTETQAPTQTEDTEAPTPITHRATPSSPLTASLDASPIKNIESGDRKPQLPVQLTPIIPKEDIKIAQREMPTEIAVIEKQEPVQPASSIQKENKKVEKTETMAATRAMVEKQKPNKPIPKIKVEKNNKPSDIGAISEKIEPFSEAENTSKQREKSIELTALLVLKPYSVVSIEVKEAANLQNFLSMSSRKIDKAIDKKQEIADNKPIESPIDAPKTELNPIEKPRVEATRSEFAFEEPSHQITQAEAGKDKTNEAVKEAIKEESPIKKSEPIVEKEEKNKMPIAEPFTAEVHENKLDKKEDIKVEKEANTAVEIKKSEANGMVRKKYLVVVGTYSDRKNAFDQQKKANIKGYSDAEIIQYTTNHLFGVCVLQSDDERVAQALARDINKSKTMEAFVKVLK